MPKLSITLDNSHLAILGIQCPLFKGHNIVHFINKNLLLELKRDDDLLFYPLEQKEAVSCAYFFQNMESENTSYFVISHKNPKPLFPRHPQVDFLLTILFPMGIPPEYIENRVAEIIRKIEQIEQVFDIRPIEIEKQTHFDYFIEDLQTHVALVNEKYKSPRVKRTRKGGYDNLHK